MVMKNNKHLLDRAEQRAARQDWVGARDAYRELLLLEPGSASTMLELSYIESLAGHYRDACKWSIRAAEIPLDSVDDGIALLRRLRTFNLIPQFLDFARQALSGRPMQARLLVDAAMQSSNINCHQLALECAEAAIQAAPADMTAQLVLGQMLAQHGDIDRAQAILTAVVRKHHQIASAWWLLSRLKRQTSQSNHVPALRQLLAMPQLGPGERAAAAYALHKELDDIGDSKGAWQALDQACRAKRSTLQYDKADSRKLIDDLIEMPVLTPAVVAVQADRTPIFIVGMHRSGTTLLEQMLDASPQLLGVGELYDFTSVMRYATDHHCKGVIDRTIIERAPTSDLGEAGRRYLESMAWRLGEESHFTDKLPSNFLNIGFICQALPKARILHVVRDPVETCFSNLRELFSDANPYSYDQLELAGYFIQYRRLMAHWHAVFPGRILDVDYARLTTDPDATIREVAAFCGLDYVDAMCDPRSSSRAVATASAVQVREGVVRRERPKWAPYARQLQPLIGALQAGGIEVPELPA